MAKSAAQVIEGSILKVVVVGGGIAGIAAAWSLKASGYQVTLVEARSFLGGRLCSHSDVTLDTDFDNGPHLFLNTYTHTRRLLRSLKLGDAFSFPWPGSIPFAGVGLPKTVLHQRPLPAPWNFAAGLLSFPGLSRSARRRTALTAYKLVSEAAASSQSINEWLEEYWDDEEREIFWLPLIHATLNSSPEAVSIKHLQMVLKDGFCRGFFGGRLGYAREPLGQLFGEKTHRALEKANIRVLLRSPVIGASIEGNKVTAIRLKKGAELPCDAAVMALPPWALEKWLPALPQGNAIRAIYNPHTWKASPISSIYLWADQRPVLDAFTCLPGTRAEWLFDFARIWENRRGPICLLLGHSVKAGTRKSDTSTRISPILAECAEAIPQLRGVRWTHWKRVTEKRGIPLRPRELWAKTLPQTTPIANLYLAGDWLDGLPPTVEAAVRSGERVAQMLTKKS